jgi:hypothetical protein
MNDAFERAALKESAAQRRRGRGPWRDMQRRWRRGQRKGFRIHATAYVAVQVLLIAVWAIQWQFGGTGHPWFVYPLLGWGVGLAAHYAAVRESLRAGRVERGA